MSYSLKITGASAAIAGFSNDPANLERIERVLPQAVNKTADRARTQAQRRILEQLNLPPSYLSPAGQRLYVSRRARLGTPNAAITARWRPTSLAQFATNRDVGASRRNGVRVQIKRGRSELVRDAFLIRLRAGTADLDTKSNLGVAVRLKPGERLRSKTKRRAVAFSKSQPGLALLYGPSVAQAFAGRDIGQAGPGVRDEISRDALVFLEREFLRLMGV